MGLTCSSAAQALSFHPLAKGSNIHLGSCLHRAKRGYSFQDGIIFSSRPLLPREKVWIRILEVEERWHGALRIGFTSMNPSNIDSTSLPPFACPYLTDSPDFWGMGIPEHLCMEGEEICFWVNHKGQVLFKKRGFLKPKLLFSGLPKKTPLWIMIDVYGQTKALQLLDAKQQLYFPCCCTGDTEPQNLGSDYSGASVTKIKAFQPPSSEQFLEMSIKLDLRTKVTELKLFTEEEPLCVICQDRMADTLLLPCRHSSFCKECVLKIRGQKNTCPLCRQRIIVTQGLGESHLLANDGS
ncbi:E3 ubiquitin-protein ligase NEURL3 isoform X1 [Bufo gargarizans]|uniref:E3 ubiquitin-protein ligase NEURL3 isoform X1 n=1 Tax=Bufo gargarizans TaxID=30331 RepID=UPI001CF4AB97|nr:E3 ubiquitin-protein ligase NEURL3 isoform X1 [Bufo gargarizans]